MTGQKLAHAIGLSQNYVAIRLRDEKPFTLDDLEKVADALGTDPEELMEASLRHLEMVHRELKEAWWAEPDNYDPASEPAPSLGLVADTGDVEPAEFE